MSNMEAVFERPFLLLLALPALAAVLLPFFLLNRGKKKRLGSILQVVFEGVASLILVLLVSGISFVGKTGGQSVMLVLDLSDSMRPVQELLLENARELFSLVDEQTKVGAVVFASDCVYTVDLDAGEKKIQNVQVAGDATDISQAIDYAAGLLPDNRDKRLILLSDGKETDSDALATAYLWGAKGLRIDAVYFDSCGRYTKEMQASEVRAAETVRSGEELVLTVVVDSSASGRVLLKTSDNGRPLGSSDFEVQEGTNELSVKVFPTERGSHVYSVSIEGEKDTLTENNTAAATVEVTGAPQVLLVTGSYYNTSTFRSILSEGKEVTAVLPRNVPTDIVELCQYDQVVFLNVDAEYLPESFGGLLENYVKDYGGSLLTVGGDETYSFGHMQDTVYEELLPVNLDFNKRTSEESVSLLLVLDCSRSMSASSQNLELAKQGAISCIKTLTENDSVGILSFCETASVVAEMTKTTESNKQLLYEAVSKISTGKGTCYGPALSLAYEKMTQCAGGVRQVIFLSDGQPSDRDFYDTLTRMREAGMVVSSIGLGFYSNYISDVAYFGGGRYYQVNSAHDLPEIMLSETELVAESPLVQKDFQAVVSKESPLTKEIDREKIPLLQAYIGTTPKEDSTVLLKTPEGHPLFALHSCGEGKVASFMSDCTGIWSERWLSDETGKILVGRFSEICMTEGKRRSSLEVQFTQKGKTTHVLVETAAATAGDCLTVSSALNGSKEPSLRTLSQTGKGVFEGEIPTDEPGVYDILIRLESREGTTVDYLSTVYALTAEKEYDLFGNDGGTLLSDICAGTGGEMVPYGQNLSTLYEVTPQTKEYTKDPTVPLVIAAGLLFLSGMAARKLRIKDFKTFRKKEGH